MVVRRGSIDPAVVPRPGIRSTWNTPSRPAPARPTGEAVLVAPEYLEGRLEWYDFEEGDGTLGVSGSATPRRAFRIPAPLDFAGMPNPRFWTFEDQSTRFDTLEMLSNPDAPPSPATLMVLDFALSYSDDWFLVPLRLDTWTVFEATTVAITDVFGDVTVAQPPDGRWNLFRLDARNAPSGLSRLFLTASPAEAIDGSPIEEVHFLRDEVANVAWAVERVTPHPLGTGVETPASAHAADVPTPPGLTWTMTPPPPPGNWFPLLPVVVGRLALGALWSARDQKPQGRLLADLRSPRQLHQEEVPPEGVQVVRRWQSARAVDGSLHLLDRPQQDATADGHRARRPFRRRRLEVARSPADQNANRTSTGRCTSGGMGADRISGHPLTMQSVHGGIRSVS